MLIVFQFFAIVVIVIGKNAIKDPASLQSH